MPPKIDPGGRGEPPDRLPRATSAKTTFIFGLLPGSKNASKSKLEFEVIFERFSRPGEPREGGGGRPLRHDQARPGEARGGQARPGTARHGQGRPGEARHGQARPGTVLRKAAPPQTPPQESSPSGNHPLRGKGSVPKGTRNSYTRRFPQWVHWGRRIHPTNVFLGAVFACIFLPLPCRF